MSGQNDAAARGIGMKALSLMEELMERQKVVGREVGVRSGWTMRTNHGEFRIEITLAPEDGEQDG